MPWMAEDALTGRIHVGKSHKGDVAGELNLHLDGKRVYQLQKFLEEEAAKGGDYFRVRWLILMSEDVRTAVASANAPN
jgi:hypothetical protein